MTEDDRVQLTVSCSDCESIPKQVNAGRIEKSENGPVQVMHNGLRIYTDSHYGAYNTEVIRHLRGHHEPQEESVFHSILSEIPPGSAILELGSFWAYYSMWFLSSVSNAKAYLVEPLDSALKAGERNFALNSLSGEFLRRAISDRSEPVGEVELWPGMTVKVGKESVDSLIEKLEIKSLAILHADIQGFEVKMLQGAKTALKNRTIEWVFISTHGENIHQKCLQILNRAGYKTIAEHTPAESYSVDGLIVASSKPSSRRRRVSKRRTVQGSIRKAKALIRIRLLEPLRLKPETT